METDEHPDDGDVVDLTATSQDAPEQGDTPAAAEPIGVGRAEPAWALPGAPRVDAAAQVPADDAVEDADRTDDVAPGAADEAGEAGEIDETDGADELAVLTAIEQDLAAVEEAMAGLDRIDADQVGGAAAATQVAAIVGSDRFTVDD